MPGSRKLQTQIRAALRGITGRWSAALECAHHPRQPALAARLGEIGEQARRALVARREAFAAGFVAESTSQPRLADPGRSSVTLPGVWRLSFYPFHRAAARPSWSSVRSATLALNASSSDNRIEPWPCCRVDDRVGSTDSAACCTSAASGREASGSMRTRRRAHGLMRGVFDPLPVSPSCGERDTSMKQQQ